MLTSDAASMPAPTPPAATPLWPRLRRWLVPLFALVVVGLLLSHAHKVDWSGAWRALKGYPHLLLLGVLGLATASHALYGCFDLIGRHYTRHQLPRLQTWAIAVASYAFNLNLGSLVGGVALRARLYARAGLDQSAIAQVVGLSLATNWLGYGLLAGSLFASGLISPPTEAHMGSTTLRGLGVLMVLLALGYVAACAIWSGREWHVRGRCLRLPSAPLALIQIALSAANWALMGAAMYFLLGGQVSYEKTLGVLMAASIVGVIMPIPGGLGVLEAVYIALLSGSVRQSTIMGAVLAYRALYYLLPLAGGLLLYAALERYASTHGSAQAASPPAGLNSSQA
jgi:glycosyltransferase 2 family protein